jgi:hypothetical protein
LRLEAGADQEVVVWFFAHAPDNHTASCQHRLAKPRSELFIQLNANLHPLADRKFRDMMESASAHGKVVKCSDALGSE